MQRASSSGSSSSCFSCSGWAREGCDRSHKVSKKKRNHIAQCLQQGSACPLFHSLSLSLSLSRSLAMHTKFNLSTGCSGTCCDKRRLGPCAGCCLPFPAAVQKFVAGDVQDKDRDIWPLDRQKDFGRPELRRVNAVQLRSLNYGRHCRQCE